MTSTWHERWAEKRTRWDLGGPHPHTKNLYEHARKIDPDVVGGKWLIPGCGRGHDGPFLLELGARLVIGKDLVEMAIDEAKALYHSIKNLAFECGDIFDVSKTDEGSFDAVFDRAMLCALSGEDRIRYVKSVQKLLRSGGLFTSIPFAKTNEPEKGPPFQIIESEIREQFNKGWEILYLEERSNGPCDEKILSEWLFIARKI